MSLVDEIRSFIICNELGNYELVEKKIGSYIHITFSFMLDGIWIPETIITNEHSGKVSSFLFQQFQKRKLSLINQNSKP